jgi:hypothetical protein
MDSVTEMPEVGIHCSCKLFDKGTCVTGVSNDMFVDCDMEICYQLTFVL